MDVGRSSKARSGLDIFKNGVGDVHVKSLGDQDEDVDIDDGDTDEVPRIDASVTGINEGANGVGAGAKSMVGRTPAPRLGGSVVSNASSDGRKEQVTPGSQASIGRQTLPQSAAGEEGSSKNSDDSALQVSREGTSKGVPANDHWKQMQAKTGGRFGKLPSEQTLSKRMALETEPSTSAPAKRTKLHGDTSDASDMPRKTSKAEDVQPRDIALGTRKEDAPMKRKEVFENGDGDGEAREKTLRASGLAREKRPRVLVLADESESDDDMFEQDEAQWTANPKSDGKGKRLSGAKAATEMFTKTDSRAAGLAKTGPASSGKQQLLLAGEKDHIPFRSAFPLHAKKKVHPPVSGDSKLHTGAGLGTQNPKYASSSAPQELNDHIDFEETHSIKQGMLSERDTRKEGQAISNQTSQVVKGKGMRSMVWVKLHVDGKDSWWPGLMVNAVPPAVQRKIDESVDEPKPKAARLFHPRKDVEEYQVVTRSWVKPFHLCLYYKDSSSHPDFIVAVMEADQYLAQPVTQTEGFSQFAAGSHEEPKLNAVEDCVRCHGEDVSHEHAESNELEFEDAETPGDADRQCIQLQADNEMETLEDEEVNQTPIEKGTGDISSGNGSGLSDKRDDLQFSQPQADKDVVEVIQVPVEQGNAEDLREAGHVDPWCSPSHGNQLKNRMPDSRVVYSSAMEAPEQEIEKRSPEATDGSALPDNRDEDVSSSTKIVIEVSKRIYMDVKMSEDIEASERTKASEFSSGEEQHFTDEDCLLDLQITPTRKLIAYNYTTKKLFFQGDTVVKIDVVSLGNEFNTSSAGATLHDCLHKIGPKAVRGRFPRSAWADHGLKFSDLDPNGSFAVRLRDTWLREYKGEPMPEFLKARFVAGCLTEEMGDPVNWAHGIYRSVTNELKAITWKKRESLSPYVLKRIVHLLEKQADRTPEAAAQRPVFKAVKGEELAVSTAYDICCHQCKQDGELLCCDGVGCRKTYHLKCLDPPLEEPPAGAFICPICLAEASTLPGAEMVTSSEMEHGIELHKDDVSRQEPQGVAESTTVVGEIDKLECPASVDSRANLKAAMVTTDAVGELINIKSSGENTLLVNERSKDDTHQVPNTNAHESEHAACVETENGNVVRDHYVSNAAPDAAVFEKLQITCPSSLVVPEQRENDVDSDLEEGEISPVEQIGRFGKTVEADIPASKLLCVLTPSIPQEVFARVEVPSEEDEPPSSDDHNSICEGCEGGGELMYVTTPSLTSTPSSKLLLCDGKGCKVVYHKECLNPPLQTVPAGEWFCPNCEKPKIEKIWSVRKACSVGNVNRNSDPKGRAARGSDLSSPECTSEDEAQDDKPLGARFGNALQRPIGEVAANEPGKASGRCADIESKNLKDKGAEYLVQWKSRSHAHDKWVSEKELERVAPKELARFKKLFAEGQVKYDSEWAEPERLIQKRLTRVARQKPDAAVDKENFSKNQNAEFEWFVKWKGLGYECCTWEPAGTGVLATSRGLDLINAYERWAEAAKQRASRESQDEAERMVQSLFKALKSQPEWMVRPEAEQLDALNELLRLWHSRMNGILVYEASQEKIVMTIMFFLSLVELYRIVHPILVTVPKCLIQNWEHELCQWAPKLYFVNYSSKLEEARDIIRRTEFSSFSESFRPQIVLTTFDVLNCDREYLKKVEWEVLIVDEGRSQRLQKSCLKSYRQFSQIRSVFRLLLLSEPLKSNVEELIQFVNFLDPRKNILAHGDESTQVAELQRRLTGRVLHYIPKNRLTEYWVPVEMTPVHLDQYYNLLVMHYPTLSRSHRDHQIQEVVTKLRQSCNHPFLADPTLEGTMGKGLTPKELLDHHIQISGKMRLLHLMMPIFKSFGWRVLIFSQEIKQLDILERYMTQSHGADSYERVDSDLAVKSKEAATQRFNAEDSKRFVLLLKTGVHVAFKNVQFVFIYDSDWNPANDMRGLHKIHNEGEASSKSLPVLRLYTHLTVEESTLILHREKQLQLPPTRATVSAKICQKLLTWGASKIFDHYDNSKGPTWSALRPKGAKVCPKAKLKHVVYNAEVASKLLKALLSLEEGSKFEEDQLLEAILVPRDEPAPLFAESEHPLNMVTGDSAEAFWASSLKWRHTEWQAKEVNMLGKGQRGRKRITYDEDAMASAAYNKAQRPEENERKRPRRRKASSEEKQDVVTGPSDPVSFQQWLPSQSSSQPSESTLPVTSTQVATALPSDSNLPVSLVVTALPSDGTSPVTPTPVVTALPSDIPERELQQENTHTSQLLQSEVVRSTHGSLNHGHVSNQNAGSETIRDGRDKFLQHVVLTEILPPAMFLRLVSTICLILDLPRPVCGRVTDLFRHVQKSSKSLRKPRAHRDIVAIQLCLVRLAAEQLNHQIDEERSITKVGEIFNVNYDQYREQFKGPLNKRLREKCQTFKFQPSPPVIVSTPSQPALKPEIGSPTTSLPNPLPTKESEPAPQNVNLPPTDAEEPTRNQSECQLAGSQGTGLQAEAEAAKAAEVAEASEIAEVEAVVEPVVEADTEVVLVEADPRLVPDEPSDTFINQNRVPESEPETEPEAEAEAEAESIQVLEPGGRITSSASTLVLGLGWVLVGPASDVPAEVLAGDPSATVSRRAGNSASQVDSLQSSQLETVPARPGVFPVEAPANLASEVPVESTQAQVLPTENTQPAGVDEQAAADIIASLRKRFNQSKIFVIKLQSREMSNAKSKGDQKLEELKRKHHESCLRPSPDPMMVSGNEELYNQIRTTLEGQRNSDLKALEVRQRADRDKLKELYNKLIFSASGDVSGLDTRKIEEEIQKMKDYYSKFESLSPSPSLGSADQCAASTSRSTLPIISSTSATEAFNRSTVSAAQADGTSNVAQSAPSANPADIQQRQHVGRPSPSAIPVTMPVSSPRAHAVQVLPQSQRPSSVQTRGQLQRSNAQVHQSPTPNVQRGAAALNRSLSTPTAVPAVPPSVGNISRPSAPASVTALAANLTGRMPSDVLVKEKERLNKDLEKAKLAYESESQRIKAEYDREAEILHKKYEALLVEQHRSFTKRQLQVQQNIVKVDWNRQLSEALKLREELAARAAVIAGLSNQTAVQPLLNHQAAQHISGRPLSGRTTMAPANISRGTASTVNAGSGISGVTMQPLGTASTRVSTTALHHTPRYGMPAAPQNEQPQSAVPGINAAGISLAEMNLDIASSSQPRSSPGLLPPLSPSHFQDPILAIVRNSVPLASPASVAHSPNAWETSTPLGAIPTGASSSNPHISEPTNPCAAGMESQVHPAPDSAPFIEATPVQLTSHIGSGSHQQVALARPPSLICLSDSDEE